MRLLNTAAAEAESVRRTAAIEVAREREARVAAQSAARAEIAAEIAVARDASAQELPY